jgi:DNA-directed RNA polymerase subunit RPC12/RpoP
LIFISGRRENILMLCGTCGSNRAEYFYWLGVLSIRCPDCGSDVTPEFNNQLINEKRW